MRHFKYRLCTTVAFIFLLSDCKLFYRDSNDGGSSSNTTIFDFNKGMNGWQGGYSDYTAGTEPSDVVWEYRSLPQPFSGNGLYTFGTNLSDDLFIYVKRALTGLVMNTSYQVSVQVTFVTSAPSGCVGVGGPPGESVVVVAGISSLEPTTVLVSGEYRVNVDKYTSPRPSNVATLGNIANTNTDCSNPIYQSKTLNTPSALHIVSDATGTIWLMIGIDSGFEAASHIYYQSIRITATPM